MIRNKQTGFSLIEVLIALLVLSVGMLGVAGLYAQGIQAGRTSVWHHNAVTLAGDIAERIRANPEAGTAYEGRALENDCGSGVRDCDAVEMAGHDILLWQQQAADTLPAGDVDIRVDGAVVPPVYTINIIWTEPGVTVQPSFTIIIPVHSI